MHRALATSIDQCNRLLALADQLDGMITRPGQPSPEDLSDLRKRLLMAAIRSQRHKDDAVTPWAYAASDAARRHTADIRTREIQLYRRFDRFEDDWAGERALSDWPAFAREAGGLIGECREIVARSRASLYPLLRDLSFDHHVEIVSLHDIDWDAERWKIVNRYPRL